MPDESQVGIKMAGRNINNLKYADTTTIMAKSKEKLNSLLMKMKKESEKPGVKLNIKKTKIMVSSLITSWQNRRGEKMEAVTDFIFLGSKITVNGDYSLLEREAVINLDSVLKSRDMNLLKRTV